SFRFSIPRLKGFFGGALLPPPAPPRPRALGAGAAVLVWAYAQPGGLVDALRRQAAGRPR
ncbi:MAG: hypothetical protein WKF96_22265, partial [Solirubrobacteraceae bacterium]